MSLNCEVQKVLVEFSPKISEVKTNRVRYESNFEETKTSDPCRYISNPFRNYYPGERVENKTNFFALVSELIDTSINEFVKDVAPYYESVRIYIRNGGKFESVADKKLRKAAKKRFKYARNLIAQNFGQSCIEFNQLATEIGYEDVNLAFNLGVCSEMNGDFTSATKYYEHVNADYRDRRKTPPGWYFDAVNRMNASIEESMKLDLQLQKSDTVAQ